MNNDLSGFQGRYAVLQQQFCNDLPIRLGQIISTGQHWLSAETAPASGGEFLILVHSLAGSAGSFDFPEISAICQQIENAIRENNPASKQTIQHLLNQLQFFIKK
ncbi:MAG: Hpt domain-containing protein [Gammaproteobacteria bacterium]|nr:Hpt domain-containing protein [Gammaproteobacteria bacterium]